MHDTETRAIPLGYNTIGGGGINNQKMAFIGLVVTAFEQNRPFSIPAITMMDQVNKRYESIPFDSIFVEKNFQEIAEHYGLTIKPSVPENLPNGYDEYFWKTYAIFENRIILDERPENKVRRLILDLLKAFEPRVRSSLLSNTLIGEIFGRQKIDVAAQFRIEVDWRDHCKGNLKNHITDPEDNYLEPERIVEKILKALPETRKIYVVCDEPALPKPKQEIKLSVSRKFGVELFFKSDFLSPFDFSVFRPLHLSLLDFDLTSIAPTFVGLSRSTFSNMVALQSHARLRRHLDNQYVYNTTNDSIILRTDNGCHTSALAATADRADNPAAEHNRASAD